LSTIHGHTAYACATNAVICEFQRTWNRPDAAAFAGVYTPVSSNYRAVMESFQKAQDVVTQAKK
jgi:hypothetical protein